MIRRTQPQPETAPADALLARMPPSVLGATLSSPIHALFLFSCINPFALKTLPNPERLFLSPSISDLFSQAWPECSKLSGTPPPLCCPWPGVLAARTWEGVPSTGGGQSVEAQLSVGLHALGWAIEERLTAVLSRAAAKYADNDTNALADLMRGKGVACECGRRAQPGRPVTPWVVWVVWVDRVKWVARVVRVEES
eukprot:82471-Chlamydomonas_euryale.AAC.1